MNAASDSPQAPAGKLTLVVALGFHDADGPAFEQAVRIGRRAPRSELHLVHVFDEEPTAAKRKDLVEHLRLYVNETAALLGGLAGMTVGIHLRAGKTVREIVQLATEVHADLIVVGARSGPSLKHWVVGSTAERLIHGGPCPVLVASPPPKEPAKHEPSIEPPCPDCVRTRTASGGAQWWCERHSHRTYNAHAFSYQRELPLASHDSEVIPTGIDF